MATQAAIWRQNMRDALRKFLAQANPAPTRPSVILGLAGRPINNLSMTDLRALLRDAGMDPASFMPGSINVSPASTPASETETDNDNDLLLPVDGDDDEDTAAPVTSDTASDEDQAESAAVESAVADIRRDIMAGGFASLDEKLRGLVVAARKPPVTIRVEVPVAPEPGQDPSTPRAAPTSGVVTWHKAFGVTGALGRETAPLWDGAHPDTPCVDPDYVWPEQTAIALTQIKRNRNVMLYGPAGTGKTEFVQQIAARLRRPFVLISCDASTDAATLVGMTVPAKDGHGVTFQPGQLVRAIQTPGAVVCIDEPSVARPGALFALQNVLTPNRALYVQETGARIKVAAGVLFFATDNTSGMGGGARRGFHGTSALNSATLDRFGVRIKMGWLPPHVEALVLCAKVPGCTAALATLLVQAATTTRAAADAQVLTEGLGLRRLFSWAELLADGIDPESAFLAAVQNCVPEAEQEALRQQCLLAVDKNTVRQALAPAGSAPLPAAARDFEPV